MKTVKDYYYELLLIAEEIISYYNLLIQNEIKYGIVSVNYQSVYFMLNRAIAREQRLYLEVESLGYIPELKVMLDKEFNEQFSSDIVLGGGVSHLNRLNSMMEGRDKSSTLIYASMLKSDINRILFSFLEEMIDNDYYGNIKDDLIQYKYSLIFLNGYNENDFMNGKSLSDLNNLSSPKFRKMCPGYHYIDEAIIELPSIKALEYLAEVEEVSESRRVKVIIKIINILARLTLGDEKLVSKYYDDIMLLLEDDSYPDELVNIARDMFQIFSNIQSKIGNGRK